MTGICSLESPVYGLSSPRELCGVFQANAFPERTCRQKINTTFGKRYFNRPDRADTRVDVSAFKPS